MLFGQLLLRQGLVTEETLNRALETQGLEHVLLGQFAVQEGYLKNEEVARILSVQKSSGKRVEKFGEVAMGLGFLTEAKLRELLRRQSEGGRLLGNILVAQGALKPLQLVKALREHEAFKKGLGRSQEVF